MGKIKKMIVFILVCRERNIIYPECFQDENKAAQTKIRLEAESDHQEKWYIHWFFV